MGRIAITFLAVHAACSSRRGLEIDVTDAPGSATSVAVIVVANDTCMINGSQCSEWGTGVSLDGTAPTPGAIDEITGYNTTALVDGSATFVVPLVEPPDNFWRVAVVAMADQKALAALVFQQVRVTSERAQLTASFAPANGTSMPNGAAYPVDLTFDPADDMSVDEPIPFPCFAVDVGGSGQGREYYVPANNHDCDEYAVTDPEECDDLWARYPGGVPAAPAIEQCVGTTDGGTCATASCADGTGRLCTPILGSDSPATYPPGTQCFPPFVCDNCTGSDAYDQACPPRSLNTLIGSALGSGDTGIIECNFVVDGSANVCGSGTTATSFTLPGDNCTDITIRTVPGGVPEGSAMVIASTTAGDGDWRIQVTSTPGTVTTPTCTVAFATTATASMVGGNDFALDVTLMNQTHLELPVHADVTWLGSGSACAAAQTLSSCNSLVDPSDFTSCTGH